MRESAQKCAKLPPLEILGPLIYIFLGWDWSGLVLDTLNLQKIEKKYFDLILAIWPDFWFRVPLRGP